VTRAVELEFRSPTYFSRSGRDVPLPDPVLVVRSLGRRWDDLAPPSLRLGPDRRRAVEDAIALSAFAGETVRAGGHQVGDRTGFVGVARFVLVGRVDGSVAGDLSTLARFAELAGVGARTGHGFGAVKVLAWE
jgi:CRISPR-associated endoribonuclease Cas6